MTNYERIKKMSVNEMAAFFTFDRMMMIKPYYDRANIKFSPVALWLKIKKWLESEVDT